jgi:hypothetical protein
MLIAILRIRHAANVLTLGASFSVALFYREILKRISDIFLSWVQLLKYKKMRNFSFKTSEILSL